MKKILSILMFLAVPAVSWAHNVYICAYPYGSVQVGTNMDLGTYSDSGFSLTQAEAGETVYFGYAPFEGYQYIGMTFMNLSSDDVTELPNGSYSFIMPDDEVKIYIYFDILYVGYTAVNIDEETFPDQNFRNWLLSQSYGSDGIISDQEVPKVVSIIANECGIHDLTGIEHFPELLRLEVSNYNDTPDENKNKIKTLDLSGNPKLNFLSCTGNQLDSLDLTHTPDLKVLLFERNFIKQINLKNTPQLQTLDCGYNQLTELDVSGNPMLDLLLCSGNQLTSLDLTNNTLLTQLVCEDNKLTNIDVSNLTELYFIYCYDNQLTSLDVSSCTNLCILYMWNNRFKGKAMDDFVNLLPYFPCGDLVVINLDSDNEQNIITKEQVAVVNKKGWAVEAIFDGSFVIYDGSEPTVGDVDGDGQVTAADVTSLYDFLLNNDTGNLVYGDVDGDGYITSSDITAIYNILLGCE